MRLVITSPPKMGNTWLKCLLATVYGLDVLLGKDTPATQPAKFQRWVDEGKFPDNTIFHQHCRYTPKLVAAIESAPARIVSIIRDPYDAFVSMYYWVQSRTEYDAARNKVRPKERPRDVLYGKPLDDPDVLAYLADGYGDQIQRAVEWNNCKDTVVVRYEQLHRDTEGELTRITNAIEPVDAEQIRRAVVTCSADNMRQRSKKMAIQVRSATVGDSKQRLGEEHLAIFREQYADHLRELGYEVR